jgi:hypothetical protein
MTTTETDTPETREGTEPVSADDVDADAVDAAASRAAAAVARRLEATDYDLGDWRLADLDGTVNVENMPPTEVSCSGETAGASWLVEPPLIDDGTVEVFYSGWGVTAAFTGRSADGEHRAGASASLTPAQARELGAALMQAAEELRAAKAASEKDE